MPLLTAGGPQQDNGERPENFPGILKILGTCGFSRLSGRRRLPNGVEVLWNPVKRRVKTRESEAPAEPRHAGPHVSDCQRFYGAAGIGAALAAGMRLSRSFALPAPTLARKSTPLGGAGRAKLGWRNGDKKDKPECFSHLRYCQTPLPKRITKTSRGERSMSIGRSGSGAFLTRFGPRGHATLPVD